MRYLFYFYSCFNSTMFGGLVDEAIELAKNNDNEVLFAYCGGINKMCIVINPGGSTSLCKFCAGCTRRVLKDYGIKAVSLHDYETNHSVNFEYKSASELRAILYKGVHIGMSIISNYISMTRNQSPRINEVSKPFFDAHLSQCVSTVDALYKLIDEYKPDKLISFNGRFEEVRPIYDISQTLHLPCTMTEVIKKDGKWYKVSFHDHLPHDIKYNLERREYCWSHYEMTEEEKIALGNSFYTKRRGGQDTGDLRIYVENQVEGNVDCFKEGKRNIAIFNSSEDEFAAVGGDWDSLKLFKNQYEGIIYLLENADPSVHFILRIHPNLEGIPYKYHTDLYNLPERYANVTVIPASSNASTYTIMEKCEKVIAFWSTMGVESSYWGKPVILLGPAMYCYDDVTYFPKTKEEAIDLLTKDLAPKLNDNIIKYGAYLLNKDPLIVPTIHINCNSTRHYLFGNKFTTNPFIKFWGGEYLTGLIIAVNRRIRGRGSKLVVPREEE